jgi:LCP family protein required for cell wall assembly
VRRPSRTVALATALALVLAGCSETPEPPARTTASPAPPDTATTAAPTSATPTSAAPTGPEVSVSGVPVPVRELVTRLYRGEDLPAADGVSAALAGADVPAGRVEVTGVTGTWQETPYAVLTSGEDLTLAVGEGDRWRVVGGVWPSLGTDEPVLGGPRHVLLIGSDAREKKGEPVDRLRADSLQVVGVDGTGGGGVLGIARDAWVPMPKGGYAKINQAMVQAGPEGQVETVAEVTGLPLEGYVLVGFEGFKAFVDDWGGVRIDAPKAFDRFKEGEQRLTGYWLLRWARHRKTLPGGDFERSFHQGLVLAAMGLKVRAAGPLGLPEVLDLVERHMESDLEAEAVLTLAAWAYLADPARFGHEVARGSFDWSADGQSIVRLDDAARDSFEDFADGNLEPPAFGED